MRISLALLVIFSIAMLSLDKAWTTDFKKGKEVAKKEHKLILLSFSGSDWCGPCIRTRKEIFDKSLFITYAASHLVLVNADFPRLKKNTLSTAQVKENESLAENFNKDGALPLTLLLDENGKILKSWKGYPGLTPEKFINEIKGFEHAD